MLDCRQNVLTSINTLIRKMTLFQNRPEDKHFARFLNGLITEVQLLRNDLVLVFNQNFYLRCKLDEKGQQLQATEKKLSEVTSRMQLALQMTRTKYEKQIHALKFARFASKDSQQPILASQDLPAEYACTGKHLLPKGHNEQQKDQQSTHQFATIKKAKQFNQFKASPAGREMGGTEQQGEKVEAAPEYEFDLQLRGLMSEEQPLFSNNRVHLEMARSNEMEEQHSKKRRGKAVSTRKEETLTHRKKKSQELAELVAQQFKVQPIKQKYFSTDLL